jgi:hypothetical protein
MKGHFTVWILNTLVFCSFGQSVYTPPTPQPIPCLISDSQNPIVFGSNSHSSYNCIEIESQTQLNGLQSASSPQQLFAGEYINIKPNVFVRPNPAPINLRVFRSDMEVAWFYPQSTPGVVGKWEKLELGYIMPQVITGLIDSYLNGFPGLNPYDPDQIDLRAIYTSPSGQQVTRYGFYYLERERDFAQEQWKNINQDYVWRTRFAPNELGNWRVSIQLYMNGVLVPLLLGDIHFTCVPSNNKGPLEIAPGNRYLRYKENGQFFFAIGHNITHSNYCDNLTPQKSLRHHKWLNEIADNGCNHTRIDMSAGFVPDCDKVDNYTSRMDNMWEMDRLFELCESRELYFILFRHHVEMFNNTGEFCGQNWGNNPYNTQLGATRTQYFEDPNIIRYQLKTHRYILARWGYSVNFLSYGYQEMDNWIKDYMLEKYQMAWNGKSTNNNTQNGLSAMRTWLSNFKPTLNLEHQIFFNNSYADVPKLEKQGNKTHLYVLALNDMIGLHKYGQSKDNNYNFRSHEAHLILKKHDKPLIWEEVGYEPHFLSVYCCTGIDFRSTVWATAFMDSYGTGMHWWWDRGIHHNEYYKLYNGVNAFFKDVNLINDNYEHDKWADVKIYDNSTPENKAQKFKKVKMETFYVKNGGQSRVYGFLNNPTYYWRNQATPGSCVSELIVQKYLNNPCYLEDGDTTGQPPGTSANYHLHTDDYTHTFGFPVAVQTNISDNETFTITGLKYKLINTPWTDKHWYKVTFYHTGFNSFIDANGNLPEITHATQVLSTELNVFNGLSFGALKPHCPNLTAANPNYVYKVEYLGEHVNAPTANSPVVPIQPVVFSKEQELIDENNNLEILNEKAFTADSLILNDVLLTIYPNPTYDEITIESNSRIVKVAIFDMSGRLIHAGNIPSLHVTQIDLTDLNNGSYFVRITLEDATEVSKVILKN